MRVDHAARNLQSAVPDYWESGRCVGFVRAVYAAAGVELPEIGEGNPRAWADLFERVRGTPRRGDVVAFLAPDGAARHVAIVTGDQTAAHLTKRGGVVTLKMRTLRRLGGFEVYRYVGPGSEALAS